MSNLVQVPDEEKISLVALKKVMPTNRKGLVNQKLVDDLNGLLVDEALRENFRENLMSFTRVLGDPRYDITEYINAVKFVSYKLLGDTSLTAYTKTFPQRYQRFITEQFPANRISSYVAAYGRTQLVGLIMEQTLVPHYVLNQGLYQKALNTQADLMMSAKSEKVRTDAANSLLTHLKMPEVSKVEIDVKVGEDDSIGELRKSTLELVKQQREMIKMGALNARQVAEQKVIQGEVIEND